MPAPKKRSTRRRSRSGKHKGGAKNVFVLYETGGPESPVILGVFNTLKETENHVKEKIKGFNETLEEDNKFFMDVRSDGMLAWSESEPNAFYVKEAPFY